jgi:hypothetical protein
VAHDRNILAYDSKTATLHSHTFGISTWYLPPLAAPETGRFLSLARTSDDRMMLVAAVIRCANVVLFVALTRPWPLDGLQRRQLIDGAALGNLRVAAPFSISA